MYDVIVIGGGSGGYAGAIRAAQLDGKVALIEAGAMGGTCVAKGCIPSKIWLRAASLLDQLRRADEFGIHASVDKLALETIVARKNGVSSDIRMGMEALLQNNAVNVIHGQAILVSGTEVLVGDDSIEGKNIIIATGSTLAMPDVPGLAEAAMTSDQLLDMTAIPASVLVSDPGYIGVELAFLLAVFGCTVTMALPGPRILPAEDQDSSQRIAQSLRERGVTILPRCPLQGVTKAGSAWDCRCGNGDGAKTVQVEKVLVCERKPAVADLGLEALGVPFGPDGGIQVNERLQTSLPTVYAIGDATGGWMLSHAASSMAICAAENCLGQGSPYPAHLISRTLWTIPEMGAVGLSEEEAEKQGLDIEVGSFPYSINGYAMLRGEVEGAAKIITEADTGKILGAHIVGGAATEIIGEAVLAMQLGATVQELAQGFRAHPAFCETVVDAARDAAGWALYLPRRR